MELALGLAEADVVAVCCVTEGDGPAPVASSWLMSGRNTRFVPASAAREVLAPSAESATAETPSVVVIRASTAQNRLVIMNFKYCLWWAGAPVALVSLCHTSRTSQPLYPTLSVMTCVPGAHNSLRTSVRVFSCGN